MAASRQSAYKQFVAQIEEKGGEVGLDLGPPKQINVRLPGLGVITGRGETVEEALRDFEATIAELS